MLNDLRHILNFFECVIVTKYTNDINDFIAEIEETKFVAVDDVPATPVPATLMLTSTTDEIKEKDRVYLLGEPDTKGMVFFHFRCGWYQAI